MWILNWNISSRHCNTHVQLGVERHHSHSACWWLQNPLTTLSMVDAQPLTPPFNLGEVLVQNKGTTRTTAYGMWRTPEIV